MNKEVFREDCFDSTYARQWTTTVQNEGKQSTGAGEEKGEEKDADGRDQSAPVCEMPIMCGSEALLFAR